MVMLFIRSYRLLEADFPVKRKQKQKTLAFGEIEDHRPHVGHTALEALLGTTGAPDLFVGDMLAGGGPNQVGSGTDSVCRRPGDSKKAANFETRYAGSVEKPSSIHEGILPSIRQS
jgi:hypothetical protein